MNAEAGPYAGLTLQEARQYNVVNDEAPTATLTPAPVQQRRQRGH